MSDNVNKIRDLIKYIIINFPNQLAWFSMSRSCSNIKLLFEQHKLQIKFSGLKGIRTQNVVIHSQVL